MLAAAGFLTPVSGARSNEPVSMFRDAEIESTIQLNAAPLFDAAGLDAERIRVHLVDGDQLNAFVANGRHMFLYRGILTESEDPGLLLGVIAHEFGHLTAGHLTRIRGAADDASALVILSTMLGVGAVIAGSGPAGAAILASGGEFAQRDFASFSRTQESAADQAALRYMEVAGYSAEGLRDLMATLAENELLLSQGSEIPYFLTHPLSSERLRVIDAHVEDSAHTGQPPPEEAVDRHKRMVAKITGFLEPPEKAYQRYPEADASLYSRYARAITKFQERLMDEALALIDDLIAEEPDNPYFHELRGQMLYETGDVATAIPSFRKAVSLAADQPLLRVGLAQALLQVDGDDGVEEAIGHLDIARRDEDDYPPTWYLLGLAWERAGNRPRSWVARAEMHLLRGEPAPAGTLARRALASLDEGTPDWFRANDILAVTGERDAP